MFRKCWFWLVFFIGFIVILPWMIVVEYPKEYWRTAYKRYLKWIKVK